ncbi:hypothetical protein BCR43DRAFT_483209 [Syncephalastrum racemosum]|uniref:Uncharacterized protein n=1 Tax=Syncephalastrum racemosum TaxID=13706 RepID=A0A1X2HUZ4_SYNRA|nr:hypothetical protein BCR43DRAFT_483209 [Syncephalastrum racemosum]
MANQDEAIQQFVGMTGSSTDKAQFFLEMANWDLKVLLSSTTMLFFVAVNQFYELGGGASGGEAPADEEVAGSSSSTSGVLGGSSLGGASQPLDASSKGIAGAGASGSAAASSSKKNTSKVRTLNDLGSNDQDDESDDDRQDFFAGGEKSGMLVKGPNKHNDLVNQILKKAAEGGPAPDEDDPTAAQKHPSFFQGSGYKLGSEEEPSELINPTAPQAHEELPLEPVTRYLTFWRNGFSVDDGPLYRYDDPANQTMLNAINSGRAPLSLLNVRHGQPVDVRVARRQDEDYVPPPKAPPKPFEGSGHRLGSPAPFAAPASPSGAAPGAYPSSSSAAAASNEPVVTVDESQPTTQLQIRLGDGSRLVAKFNHTQTVGDIRRYIDGTRPADRSYILQTTFPVKELTDETQTLKDAGLLNTVIVQRYQ